MAPETGFLSGLFQDFREVRGPVRRPSTRPETKGDPTRERNGEEM
jgi:hypothetical protein